jgi:hypothetical protein
MPHDAVTLGHDVFEKDTYGQHDLVVTTKYEAPSGPDCEIIEDEYKEADMILAKKMMEWLRSRYPGYPWCAISDLRQGIVKFNIPILMGVQNYWVINLRTHTIADGIVEGAGQILERYKLRRGAFQLAPFLDAREKHSALVVPSREVPE